MPTVTFANVYVITPVGVVIDPRLNTELDFSAIYTDPLNPGDTFTIDPGPPGDQTYTVTYLGVSAAGEMEFSFTLGGVTVTAFLTNTDYALFSTPPTFNPVDFCFLAGTRILTPLGEKVVESLAIGDLVVTADGRAVPVKWVGRQTIPAMYGLSPRRSPVSIAAGALGEGLPSRELRVTGDHALLLDGVLVQAGALVNGRTIRRMPTAELGPFFMVYHLETETHETVLAEGVPAETFIDNVSRRDFDNYAEYEALYGTVRVGIVELGQPRAMSARQVPLAIRALVAARAEAISPVMNQVA